MTSTFQPELIQPYDVVGGRLDLVSATSLKWAFTNSAQIRLFNGSAWRQVTCSTEPTLANTAYDITGTVALQPNTIYDIFAEYSSSTAFNLVASRWATGGDGANNTLETYNATAAMTALNAPGPNIVTRTSAVGSGNEAWTVFDQAGAIWVASSTSLPQTIMYDFGAGNSKVINKYRIVNHPDGPTAWTLEGTNGAGVYSDASGTNGWVVLDTRSGQGGSDGSYSSFYYTTVSLSSQPYQKYRMVITAKASANALSLREIQFVASANSLAGGSSRVRTYEATVIYNAGDRVTYGGHDWVCILQTTAGTTPVAGNYWVDNGTSVSGDFSGLYRYDGVLVSDSSATGKKRRWLGIIYTFNNGGTVNFRDDVNYRYVSNWYNRKNLSLNGSNSTSSWVYTSATVRENANGSGATRPQFVSCITRNIQIGGKLVVCSSSGTSGYSVEGIGFNSNTAMSHSVYQNFTSTAIRVATGFTYNRDAFGYNWIAQLEAGDGTNEAYRAGSLSSITVNIEG